MVDLHYQIPKFFINDAVRLRIKLSEDDPSKYLETQTPDVIFYLEFLKKENVISNYFCKNISEKNKGHFNIDISLSDERNKNKIERTFKDFYNAKSL
jgi:hypothetical protein